LAAGWVSGLVQAYIKRPSVADFETLSEDVFSLKGFWRNKFTRVLLVIILTNIGGSFGTFIGGADVIRTFFNNL
jgi:pheromone shutdown protein TraB